MLTDKQKHLYMLFKEVDALCRKHNIEYQLAGGTLIGAVRHRGFIPWDDDMDITMTRNNWEKFIEVCKNELPKNRVLECQELNHDFHNVIARYTDTTSSAVHSTQVLANDTAGDMIDIICYDYLPNAGKAWKQYTKDITLYSDLINPCIVYSYRFCANQLRYGFYRLKIRLFGRDKVLDKLQEKMFSYKEEDCPYLVLRWGGTPLLFKKEIFGSSCNNVLFEDTMGQAPDFINDYLVEHYEDEWMFVPPATEQGGHNSIYSLDTDYKVIRKEINHFLNPEKERKTFLRKKSVAMQIMAPWLVLKNLTIHLDKKKKSNYFTKLFNKNAEKITTAYTNCDFQFLEEFFSEFITLQFSKEYFGRNDYNDVYKYKHPVVIKIPSDVADKIIMTLFVRGKISKAMRMIEVYEQRKKVTPFMTQMKKDILLFRQAVHNVSIGNLSEADRLSEQLFRKEPHSLSEGVLKLSIIILIRLGITENMDKLNALITKALDLYPEDGELFKYQLDINIAEKDTLPSYTKENVFQYISAYHKTLNGLVRLDIQDIVKNHLDYFTTVEEQTTALAVLPDNLTLCKKYFESVIKCENPQKVYSLFSFLFDKQEVFALEYENYYNKLCSYFINSEELSILLSRARRCQDYTELLAIEDTVKALPNTPEKQLIMAVILYKKGYSHEATSSVFASTETENKNLLVLAKQMLLSDLKQLREALDFANSLTHFDVSTNTETPATDEQKNKVLSAFLTKWTAPWGNGQALATALEKTGITQKKEDFTDLSSYTLTTLLDKLEIFCTKEESLPFSELDPLKNKIDGPMHFDHNLTEKGDIYE